MSDDVRRLAPDTDSLARRIPYGTPSGTLCVRGPDGGVQVVPGATHVVTFGRAAADVDVPVGVEDPAVSRTHGRIAHDGRKWRLTNTGNLPIRFPGSELLLQHQDEPLSRGYTPLFIKTDSGEHVLEVLVTARETPRAQPRPDGSAPLLTTIAGLGAGWARGDVERLVLVGLAQRYLLHSPHPQPIVWADVVAELKHVRPDVNWTEPMVQGRVLGVRKRLRAVGVEGCTATRSSRRSATR